MNQITETIPASRCPYCRYPIDAVPAAGRACEVCKTVHHTECWTENEGCAVALCAGGVTRSEPDGGREIPERRPVLVVDLDHEPTAGVPAEAGGRSSRKPLLVVGLLVLIAVIALVILLGVGVIGTIGIS